MTTIIIPLTTKEIELKEILEKIKSLRSFNLNILILCEKKHKIALEFENFKRKINEQSKEAAKEKTETAKKTNKNLKKQENTNINLYTFPNGTKEDSMISFGINSLTEGDFILLRNDVKEITTTCWKKFCMNASWAVILLWQKSQGKKIS